MAQNKALAYAEEDLGVHKVWEQVQEYLTELDAALDELDKALDIKRDLNEKIADREVELIHEMRGIHPNMSDTGFKTELKGWERKDEELSKLRYQINEVLGTVQGVELNIDLLKLRIRASSARLEELGGYLHYLAAVKTAARQAEKTTQPTEKRSE